ncbi:MAG: AAA family ATPase [Bacteroidales bacterium]|nr:AAA family ATPase [Bacteroidales bacterium]
MELINLHDFIEKTIAEFDSSYFAQDRKLPDSFKEYVKSNAGGEKFTFYDYTTVVASDLSIYCPNQWFYIAAYYCKLYPVLQQYKDIVYSKAKMPDSPRDYQTFFAGLTGKYDESKLIFAESDLPSNQIELLAKFVSDYSWWRGGKGIERNDFYYSPILSAAALVNQSQSYVADICKYLVENPAALNILTGTILGKSMSIVPTVVAEDKVLVAFMEKCVKEFLSYDPNFSRAKFKINAVTVGWNGCKVGMLLSEFRKTTDPRRKDDCNPDITWTTNGNVYCFCKEQSGPSFGVFKNSFNTLYQERYKIIVEDEIYKLYVLSVTSSAIVSDKVPTSHQIIFYGAPGTGKSHAVEEDYVKGHKSFRITFHPDTDYASFVGCYKPTMKPVAGKSGEEEISYSFVPQVFLNAYVYAWNNPGKKTFLVIEELNRGNCAQIFGDVFQLLDRRIDDYPGFSKYKINADSDIAKYLNKHIKNEDGGYENRIKEIYSLDEFDFSIMAIPDNLYILATMNTSDQSLFPIDSAFKRRWEWEYVKVNYPDATQFTLKIDDKHKYNWGDVLLGLNNYIKGETHNTNKILGNRFVQAGADKTISAKSFRDKVLFFLFNDVFKDDDDFKTAFFGDNAEDKFFEDLCVSNDIELTIKFIENICGAKNIAPAETPAEETTETTAE